MPLVRHARLAQAGGQAVGVAPASGCGGYFSQKRICALGVETPDLRHGGARLFVEP